MSIIGNIESFASKGLAFVLQIVNKTSEIDAKFVALAPTTKAAILATFYDAIKTATAVGEQTADVAAGNFTGAVLLTQTTTTLVQTVVADVKNDGSVIKADLVALGIIKA
jgi:hypothetical protein